ncbi:hypothetical protein ABENE_18390 [Asticcacaulis benevestitus DSM 16100 = ATCC BAA-896]|uniref:TonB-dependent receptor n=1 Tax=Asticcacaulis benevestitus DSM 16100 = ATCC BAA-896 TaxID=1121022 RepID=V4R4T4_9CAUL|nr:hypothetical protein ABENE_18390 [Asticcacaulis benevestitus DSM 16100 = ATCC BAA-896]
MVVTARRKALQNATERKKNSDTVIDSVVADEAGKLPDTSVTEVLSRVAGVTMVRFGSLGSPDQFSWEGTDVQIRGLSGITGLLNGREIFSANGGSGLSWGEVTPEMMSAVDVYKGSNARLIEGGLGGSIDLRTRMPFDYGKPEIGISAAYSYGDLVKKGSPSGSVLMTRRFDTPIGEMGVLVDVARAEFQSADSFMRSEPYYQQTVGGQKRYVPGGFDYGNDTFDRTRTGFYEAFQWKPNDQLTLYQTVFASNYKTVNGGGGVFADVSFGQNGGLPAPVTFADAQFDSNGLFVSGTLAHDGSSVGNSTTWAPGSANNSTPSENTTADFSQGFTWNGERLKLAGALQYVAAWHKAEDYGMGIGEGINLTTMHMDLTGDLPVNTIANSNTAMVDSAHAAANSIVWNVQKNEAHMTAVNLDATYELGDGFFRDVKAGVRYADRAETDTFTGTWWSAINESWNGAQKTVAQSPAEDWAVYSFPNFFKGDIPVPGSYIFSSPSTVICGSCLTHNIVTYGSAEFPKGAATTIADLGAPQTNNIRIETASVYGEVRFASDSSWFGGAPFTGNFGLRVVQDTVHSRGTFTVNTAAPFFLSQADANTAYAQVGGTPAAAQAYMAANNGNMPLSYRRDASVSTPVGGDIKYTRALPSVNFSFKPDDVWLIRFAVNQSLSPPSYSDDRVGGKVSISTSTNANNAAITSGPQMPGIFSGYSGSISQLLKPQVSTNEDLSIEWYPKPSLTAHLDLFNKSIKDFIVFNQSIYNISGQYTQYGSTSSSDVQGALQVVQNFNSNEKTNIRGFELGARAFFDQLPSPLDGLGIEANYTHVDSRAPSLRAVGMDGNTIPDITVPGLSKEAYNINLLYDKGPWDARLAYSWRGDYLATTTGNGTNSWYNLPGAADDPVYCKRGADVVCYSLPIYGSAYGQLDGSVSYKVNDRVQVSFQASNLLDGVPKTKMEVVQGIFATRSWFKSDRRYEISLRMSY